MRFNYHIKSRNDDSRRHCEDGFEPTVSGCGLIRPIWLTSILALIVITAPAVSHAYIGPGAGFALVSSFLTFIIAFFAAFFAILTFPVRMLIRKLRMKKPESKAKAKKVIILGLDGLDPVICDRLIARGELPTFAKLAERGSFKRLGTSIPAMSPVAWSSFATGADASRHGIYDFLSRDPRSYLPVLSSSSVSAPTKFWRIGPFAIPRGKGKINNLRRSKSFWRVLSEYGVFNAILRVPITFPVEKINGVMLSGMCVPDLRGTMGSFTYFTEHEPDERIGGMIIKLEKNGNGFTSALPGPKSPIADKTLEAPFTVKIDRERGGATIDISKQKFFIKEREYSEWIPLTFKAAPGMKLSGIARFYITRLDGDFGLYVTPIHIDPDKPAMPVSHPNYYATYLAKRQGHYGTLGLNEDTWALNERVIDEEAFIKQAYLYHRERETMWFETLKKLKSGLAVVVFDISDRLQHMFFRYLVDDHAANKDKDTVDYKDTLYQMYREMDKLLAKTLKYVDSKTTLFVISDHGFKPFTRGVDLNAWLRDNGYLVLKEGAPPAEYLTNVDWSKTKAYAIGLGGIFINLQGREGQGIVDEAEIQALKDEMVVKLKTIQDSKGKTLVSRVFDVDRDFSGPYRKQGPDLIVGFIEGCRVSWDCARGMVTDTVVEDNIKSWSGDHCMDPDTVPGIIFSNKQVTTENPNLVDLAPTVLDQFGVTAPGYMTGRNIL